jgi:diguanylate cyclase (GGDEF)-like protein
MNLRLVHRLAALALAFLCAHAPAQQLPLKTYGQAEGLANLAVIALAQDAAGYLWIGTENGLYRFNGAEFRHYGSAEGLRDNFVTALLGSRSMGMWAGTWDNLFHVEDGRLVPVLFEGKPLAIDAGQLLAESADKRILLVNNGRLLAAAPGPNGIVVRPVFTPAQLRDTPELAKITSIYVDADGSLWMGCGQALCHAGGGRVDVAGGKASVMGDGDGLPSGTWSSIARDGAGTLWVRSAAHVFAMPAGTHRFEERTPPGIGKRVLRTELFVDPEGRLLTNDDGGVVRWERGSWTAIGAEQGLRPGGGVMAILQDRGHGIWLGTRGRGLVHWLGYGNLENWGKPEGLPDDVVMSVQRDTRGILHVGTRSGHAWQAPGEREFHVDAAPAVAKVQWYSMTVDAGGSLWAGTYSGALLRRAPGGGPPALINRDVLITQVLADRGLVWMATKTGLHFVPETAAPGTQWQQAAIPSVAGHRPEDQVTDGCRDASGGLWFSSKDNVLHYDGSAWRVMSFGADLRGTKIMNMACARDGTLLAIAQDHLWRLHPGATPRAEHIDAPILRGRSIYAIATDSRGWIWAGLDVGFAVWNGTRWRLLDQSHGLVWNDTNGRGAYEDSDGSMWLITSNGLSHVLHPERLFAPVPRNAMIEEALRGDRPLRAGPTPLPWTPDQIVFHLASLQYEDRHGLRYRFRLLGADDHWNETTQPEVRYGALPGGDYRFQLVVVDGDTGQQSPMAERAFSIAPPWWRSTLFYGLCALAIAGAFVAFHRLRLRAHRARGAKLAALVRERTRELEESREEMRMRALKDGLTQCWNRVAMMEMVEREIEKCVRSGDSFALVLLDLDFFKRVNDTHGHLAGDAVLVETARRLRAAVRPYDAVGRYGGEEFVVLLPGLNLPADAGRIDALRAVVRGAPVDIGDGQTLDVTASFGVVAFTPGTARDPVALLGRADEALYRSKHEGRDRITYAAGIPS